MRKTGNSAAIVAAVAELSEVQLRNRKRMKDMLNVYQPVAFGTAWGNDPDYIRMTDKLKKALAKHHLAPEKKEKKEVLGKKMKSKGSHWKNILTAFFWIFLLIIWLCDCLQSHFKFWKANIILIQDQNKY